MKREVLVFLVLIVAIGRTTWAQDASHQVGFITEVGQQIPDFKVEMLDGTLLDTKTLRGKVILLDFWGAKCGGCLLAMKRFSEEILKPYGNRKDFFLLPIEAQNQSKEVIESCAAKQKFTFPLAYENGKDIAGLFFKRIFGLPRTLIIDRKGKIVYQSFGYDDKEFKQMLQTLGETINVKD